MRTPASAGPSLLLATYFGSVAEHAPIARGSRRSPALHLDLVRAPEQLDAWPDWPEDKVLSLGVVNGRNLWRTDLARALSVLHPAKKLLGERLWISASCSAACAAPTSSLEIRS